MKHIFAVCAYKDSPYLEECLESLKNQLLKSKIIICTSTPSLFLSQMSVRYGCRLFVREGKSSLKDDWNYAMECAISYFGAELVTLSHQDDVYEADYSLVLKKAYELYPDMSLFCSASRTIDAKGSDADQRAEEVKHFLRLGLRLRKLSHLRLVKRSALVFGNAICCPSCTYNISLTGLPVFTDDDEFVTDWKALLRLSNLPGRFVLSERKLIRYRIHPDAQTRKVIDDHLRAREEAKVYKSLWPGPIAYLLSFFMHASYGAYK